MIDPGCDQIEKICDNTSGFNLRHSREPIAKFQIFFDFSSTLPGTWKDLLLLFTFGAPKPFHQDDRREEATPWTGADVTASVVDVSFDAARTERTTASVTTINATI